MKPTLLLVMTALLSSVVGNYSMKCSFGEQLHTSKEGLEDCIICDDGTFMSEESHTNRKCNKCTSVLNFSLEIEITKCNRTHDAVIDCICGYCRYIARRKGEKDECKPNQVCQLPVHPFSSYHGSFVENTTMIGLTVDADNITKGTSLFNGTLDSGDLNNAVTEQRKPASHDVVILSVISVTLCLTLMSTLYRIFWNDKHKLVICCVCALLSVALIICILFKTVNLQISDVFTNVFVGFTLIAAEIYIAVINVPGWGRRLPTKRHDKEESQHDTLGVCIPLKRVKKLKKDQHTGERVVTQLE